jgi:thiol-disulfide isomerase/thioredoxin
MSTAVQRKRSSNSKRARTRARQERAKKSQRFFIGGTVLLVALFGVAIAVTSSGNDSETDIAQTRSVSITGDALPSLTEEDRVIGVQIPEVEGSSFEAEPLSIERNGIPKAIIFLAHWCPHCQNEVPVVQAWLEDGGMPAGIELVSVATSTDRAQVNYPPSEWLDREGWSVPTIVDDARSSVATAYGVDGYPFFVFVDAEGNVHHRESGELPIERIESILAEL